MRRDGAEHHIRPGQPLHTGRQQRHAHIRADQAEQRLNLDHLLADLRGETGLDAALIEVVGKARFLQPEHDKGLVAQLGQRQPFARGKGMLAGQGDHDILAHDHLALQPFMLGGIRKMPRSMRRSISASIWAEGVSSCSCHSNSG